MEKHQAEKERQKSMIIDEIDKQCLEAINAIQDLKEIDSENFINTHSILTKIPNINYNINFKNIINCIPSIKDLMKASYNTIKLLILGDTNVGKSTLASKLTGAKYFPSSNKASTFCPTRLLSDINENANPFKVIIHEEMDNDSHRETEFIPKTLEECIKLINNYKRNDETQHIDHIDVHVKQLSRKCGLLDQIVILDTPGVNDSDYGEETFLEVKSNWNTSIILIVVYSGCGTLKLSSLNRLLEKYRKYNYTERIIFIFTKVINHIQEIKSEDDNITIKQAINSANETLKTYKQQIELDYPNASYIFFDQDNKQSKMYYYHMKDMKYATIIQDIDYDDSYSDHNGGSSSNHLDKNFVNIGDESIQYLKQKINELTIKISDQIAIDYQENKLDAIRFLKGKISSIILENEKLLKQINNFKYECKQIFDHAKNDFKKQISIRLEFDPNYQNEKSLIKPWIRKKLEKLNNSYKDNIMLNQANYQQYLATELLKKIHSRVYRIASDALDINLCTIRKKFSKLLGEYSLNENIFTIHRQEHNNGQHIDDNNNTINTKHAVIGMGLLTIAAGYCIPNRFKALWGVICSGIAISYEYLDKYDIKTRQKIMMGILDTSYQNLINNQGLKSELDTIGIEEINALYEHIHQNCHEIFELKESDLPGWEQYNKIQTAVANIEDKVKKLKDCINYV